MSTTSPSPPDPVLDAKKFVPRRAMLYVPGDDENKLKKIPGINADCAILECEDGVALNRKADARNIIAKVLDEITFGRTEPVLRVNSIRSGFAEDDLKVVLRANNTPPTIAVPKIEGTSDIEWVAEKVIAILNERKLQKTFNLIIYIESAMALLNFESICRRAVELSEMGCPLTLEGVVFGSDDFCASIGAERTKDAKELLYARQKLLLVAKAFQIQAIDLVHIDLKDLDGLREQALEGARMGFTGKQVIHPSHVPIVQEAFYPNAEKVEWATELIKEFEGHQATGAGAFTFRGSMIDMPLLRQAKNIIQLVESIKPAPH